MSTDILVVDDEPDIRDLISGVLEDEGYAVDAIAEAVQRVRPWGVDVATGVESVRPLKDDEAIARFVAAARSQR